MQLANVFVTSGRRLFVKVAGPVRRTGRLNLYTAIAAHAAQADAEHLVLDKSDIAATDYEGVDIGELGFDEVALWLASAGLNTVTVLPDEDGALAEPLVGALRGAGLDAEIAEQRDNAALKGWSPPFTGRS